MSTHTFLTLFLGRGAGERQKRTRDGEPRPPRCAPHWRAAAVLGGVCGALVLLVTPTAWATNYLVIIADDLGVDKVQAYAADYPGYAAAATYLPRTSTLDALAAAGLRFTRAWTTPLCSPTRVAFQTGQHPFRTGIGYPLGSTAAGLDTTAFTMLADSFTNAGYATGYFGKWHLGTENAVGATGTPATSPFYHAPHPALAGWERFFGTLDGVIGDYWHWNRVSWLTGRAGSTGPETTHATARTAAVALHWINSRTTAWLAVVAFHAPHAPTAGSNWSYADADPTQVRSAALACLITSSCADEDRAVYQALVEQVDIQVATLLRGMAPAVLDDTIILFFGDNGTPSQVQEGAFDVVPARGKGTTYENGLRVPLIIADGGTWRTGARGAIASPNRAVTASVHVLDLYQTLHSHALQYRVASVDSNSFVHCFTHPKHCGIRDPYGYAETYLRNGMSILQGKVAVRYGDDKMVAEYVVDPVFGPCVEETFYETSNDPFETAPQAWVIGNMRGDRLRDHFTSLHAAEPTSWAFGLPFCP